MKSNVQDLSKFALPKGFRGRNPVFVQLWWATQATLFKLSPQFAYGYRALLLRLFGAKIGKNTIIRPSVKITYPWKVVIGDNCWIGDDATLYSLGDITIGSHAVISQGSYLCAADHDYSDPSFLIRERPIQIGEQAWLAAFSFVAPGVSIGDQCVIGARSSVFSNMPEGMLCYGSPCRPVRARFPVSSTNFATSPSEPFLTPVKP